MRAVASRASLSSSAPRSLSPRAIALPAVARIMSSAISSCTGPSWIASATCRRIWPSSRMACWASSRARRPRLASRLRSRAPTRPPAAPSATAAAAPMAAWRFTPATALSGRRVAADEERRRQGPGGVDQPVDRRAVAAVDEALVQLVRGRVGAGQRKGDQQRLVGGQLGAQGAPPQRAQEGVLAEVDELSEHGVEPPQAGVQALLAREHEDDSHERQGRQECTKFPHRLTLGRACCRSPRSRPMQ